MVGVDDGRKDAIARLCTNQKGGVADDSCIQHQLEQFCQEPAVPLRDRRPGRCSSSPPTGSTAAFAAPTFSTQSRRLAQRARASRLASYQGEGARASRPQRRNLC
jgi:hypothetical protein